jgi:cell division septal protein FtsQ
MKNIAKPTEKQQKINKIQTWRQATLAAFASLCFAGLCVLLGSPRFQLVQFRATSGRTVAALEVYKAVRPLKGKNFILASTTKIASNLQKDPRIESVAIRKQWPRTIAVDVTERTPTLILQTKQGFCEVDAHLIPFRRVVKATPSCLPVTWEQDLPALGTPISGTAGKALQTCVTWSQQNPSFPLARLQVKKTGMLLLYRKDGVKVQLGDANRLGDKLVALGNLLEAEKMLQTRSDIAYINLYHPERPAVLFIAPKPI